MKIPFLDLKAQHQALAQPLRAAMDAIMADCAFVGGAAVQRFEQDFAAAMGAASCVGVGNGTDALIVALKAMGIGPGDQVIVPANSFTATAEAVCWLGARPVFVDCVADTYLMDLNHVADRIGPNTRAVVPVHLFGNPVDMPALAGIAEKHGLKIVADCAQAHGAALHGRSLGAYGDAMCYSFYPGKILGACGDGGAVVADDPRVIARARMIANHGAAAKYRHEIAGLNSRLDGVQAAILSVKLPHLDDWVRRRRDAAALYGPRLSAMGLPVPDDAPGGMHAYHLYVTRVPDRARIIAALAEQGVETGVHYPCALPNLPAYAFLGHKAGDFPTASRLQDEILSLPIYPEITPDQIAWVCDALAAAL